MINITRFLLGGLVIVLSLGLLPALTGGSAAYAQEPTATPPLLPPSCQEPAVDSPFGLEIAALGEIKSAGVQSLSEAEWRELYAAEYAQLTDALEESGADWTRVVVDWGTIQPDDPQAGSSPYNWYPYHDVKLGLVADTGVQIIATLHHIPDWAADNSCGPIYTNRLDDFAQFLTDLVYRYKQPPYNIRHWELFNEPDGVYDDMGQYGWGCWGEANSSADGPVYAQMAQVAYQTIKQADPQAKVLMGGIAYDSFVEYNYQFDRYFVDDIMAAGTGRYVDITNFHYFPDWSAEWERWDPNSQDRQMGWLPAPTCGDMFDGVGTTYEAYGPDVMAKVTHFKNRLETCHQVRKPVWITELGAHSEGCFPDPNCWTPERQARYIIQGYSRGLAGGATNIFYYALSTPNDSHIAQGLLDTDWSPKPAFYAYQTMTDELDGYQYAQTLSVADGEGYLFRRSCWPDKVVAWGDSTLTLSPANQLHRTLRDGVALVVTDGGPNDRDGQVNRSIELQLLADEEPLFVSVRDFRVAPDQLVFQAVASGDYPASQSFVISSYDASPLSWTASENIDWLSLDKNQGSTSPATVTVSVDTSGLGIGLYTEQVTVSSPAAVNSQPVDITLSVGSGGSGSIDPTTGGVITTSDGTARIEFPPQAVSQTTSVTLTTASAIPYAIEGFRFGGYAVDITATPDSDLLRPFTLTLNYEEPDWLAESGLSESDLNLYYWNGSGWEMVSPCAGCRQTETNTLSIVTDHLTEFVFMAPLKKNYLPLMMK